MEKVLARKPRTEGRKDGSGKVTRPTQESKNCAI